MISRRAFVLGGGALVGGLAGAGVGGAVKSRIFGEQIAQIDGFINKNPMVAFSPDGKMLVAVEHDGIGVWDLSFIEDGKLPLLRVMHHRRDSRKLYYVYSIAFPDNSNLLRIKAGDKEKYFEIDWDIEAGKLIKNREVDENYYYRSYTNDGRYYTEFSRFSGQGNTAEDISLEIYDANTSNLHNTIGLKTNSAPSSLRFSPDDNFFSSTFPMLSTRIEVWNMKKGRLQYTISDPKYNIDTPALFSKDGKYLFYGSHMSSLNMRNLYGQLGYIYSNYFWDSYIGVWELEKQRLVHKIRGHKSVVRNLDISPDGKYLVSGSMDNTVRIWDLEALIG